jgi:hypothetical protein
MILLVHWIGVRKVEDFVQYDLEGVLKYIDFRLSFSVLRSSPTDMIDILTSRISET